MCGNTREYPHNLSPYLRRFKNGVWQKPTSKGRGWTTSIGLAGQSYEAGVKQLAEINRQGRGYTLVDATTPDQVPVAPVVGADVPTNPNHRRFNTALGIWEKPNASMTGWQPSGIANYSLEAGNAFFAKHEANGSRHGYINIGPTEQPFVPNALVEGGVIEPVANLTNRTRNWNSALGIWEKPTRDLTSMVPSDGLRGMSFNEGLDYLAEYFPAGLFTVTFDGAVMPTITVLPNGGMTVTVDARGAVALARAAIAVIEHNQESQDAQYLAPFGAALVQNRSNLFTDAVETLRMTPFGA